MDIRPFEGELDALVALWNRCLVVDPISASRLEARVLLNPNFDNDLFLVARDGDRLAGFVLGICGEGVSFPTRVEGTRAWILAMAVDEPVRGCGTGTALLDELETRFRQAGKSEVWMASYPTAYLVPGIDESAYPGGLGFFQSRGYQVAYRALAMDASLWPFSLSPDVTQYVERKMLALASQGVAVHAYHSRWLIPFRRFLRQALPWDWEMEALRNLARCHDGRFSPEQILLAIHEGQVVGYCQFEGAHFGPFGVVAGYQRLGIGTVLLARALASISRQGQHSAWVLWTGGDAARLYARFGFEVRRRFAVLHHTL